MEEELQELRALVAQFRADNEKLQQGQVGDAGRGAVIVEGPAVPPTPSVQGADNPLVMDHLVLVPRDRRCPKFSEGEAREEIRYRYIEAFFSRKQQEGETLLEFSLALLSLLERVKQRAPGGLLNTDILLRDQFVEYVVDNSLRRELKQLVRRQPTIGFLEVRGEAIRWEREGIPGGSRSRSQSVPLVYGTQYGVQGEPCAGASSLSQKEEMNELRDMLQSQEQIAQLIQSVAHLHHSDTHSRSPHRTSVICRRCQKPGHFARECDGERVPPRSQASSSLSSSVVRIGKLIPPVPQSHGSDGELIGSQHFEPWGREKLQSCQWLQLRAVNGLPIPYIGYMELDVVLCGRRCYQGLFGQHGPALFDLPEVSTAQSFVSQALQDCQVATILPGGDGRGRVKVQGRQSCCIPGGTMKFVPATCSGQYANQVVLFEPPESGLPVGLLAPLALVQVVQGTVYVPIVNVGVTDVMLYRRSIIGTLANVYLVSLPTGVTEVLVVATVHSHVAEERLEMQEQIEAVDLSRLAAEE
ncbi:Branchpoint-bridging protein [Labeo rohita]|uniref:Branchpoint-bridging protein n=1 Tax=Labeo rohita TaxID=84645 RepID=A0ABQ8MQR8_LABRO|nr:Branchpoint-bridging protein [Labeo rohita]